MSGALERGFLDDVVTNIDDDLPRLVVGAFAKHSQKQPPAAPRADRSRVFDFHHLAPAGAIAFSPSGRHLAVGLGNGLIAILRTPPDRAR